jgi:ABC-type transport system involved in cytochrome c biogenesis permease subunit
VDGISRFCFEASYTLALACELAALVRPIRLLRLVASASGVAGLLAHTLFLAVQRPTLHSPYGSLLLLAWVLAVFGIYGAVHHPRFAWAVFVLPLVIGLCVLAGWYAPGAGSVAASDVLANLAGERFWGTIHGGLLLLAAVGVSVGFVASVMYLVQARRLRAKSPPNRGVRLLSLERLEAMNRRAVNLAFPLLTVGLLVGAALMAQRSDSSAGWSAIKITGTYGLWLLVTVLLYLRYGLHVRGRHLALGTIGAFILMLAVLAAAHPFVEGPP